MRKVYVSKYVVFFLLIINGFLVCAEVEDLQLKLQQKITETINHYDPHMNIGCSLLRLSDSKILYSLNEDRYYTPASVNKLFTAAAALAVLPPDHKFKTQLWLENVGSDSNKKNIYVKFVGSPELTIDDLLALFLQLKLERPDIAVNHVFIDEEDFFVDWLSPSVQIEDLDFCYASPISAIAINKNSTNFKIVPAKTEGGLAHVTEENGKMFSLVKSKVVTTKSCDKNCELDKAFIDGNYVITGKMHAGGGSQNMCLAIKDVNQYAKAVIENILKQHNFNYSGKVTFAKMTVQAELFAEHLSRDLLDILSSGIKNTDNFLMNAIFLQLAFSDKPRNWFIAGEIVANILYKKYNLPANSLSLEDGSGIGRNFVTPKTMVTFLEQVYRSDNFTNFAKTFPIAAADGTLLNRLLHMHKNVQVIAKTGTTSKVLSLAGYMQSGKETYAFVIFLNGNINKPKYYREMLDKIVENIGALVAV